MNVGIDGRARGPVEGLQGLGEEAAWVGAAWVGAVSVAGGVMGVQSLGHGPIVPQVRWAWRGCSRPCLCVCVWEREGRVRDRVREREGEGQRVMCLRWGGVERGVHAVSCVG
jgi:hypothetical protein